MKPLIPWRDALAQILETVRPAPAVTAPVEVHTMGATLAQDVRAQWDFPSADVSVMDGYAARSTDMAAPAPRLRQVGESAAGHPMGGSLPAGACARISTGAVLPEGADLVIPQEDVVADAEGIVVNLDAFGEVAPGRWVRRRGSEVIEGEVVLPAGRRLGAADLAVAASTGNTTRRVHPRPRVAVVSTGD